MKKSCWNRGQIVNLLLDFEQKVKPETFVVDDVKIWPWVRVQLFFYLIDEFEGKGNIKRNDGQSFIKNPFVRIVKNLSSTIKETVKLAKYKEADYLYVGYSAHRGTYNGVSYNRFFDSFRKNFPEKRSLLIEYSTLTSASYLPYGNVNFPSLKWLHNKIFRKDKPISKTFFQELAKEFGSFLKEHEIMEEKIVSFIDNSLPKRWYEVQENYAVWKVLLNWIKPKKIFTLCYYNGCVYGLNLAADSLGIETYEMQHGPINDIHLSYGSFHHIPFVSDSTLFPKVFLTWEKNSKKALEKSFPKKQIIEIGHPWLDFIQEAERGKSEYQKIITFALQPASEIEEIFPSFVVEWIKDSSKEFTWWFRLHPRQMNEYKRIKDKLKDILPGGNWELDEPTLAPLPIVLNKSTYLFTPCSGVVTEAAFMGIPVVAFHENALKYFYSENEKGLAYICNKEDKKLSWCELQEQLSAFFKDSKLERKNSLEEFRKLIA